ncbi:hypothetical protein MTO96_007556 [Rhipicephalus appendiculatus]
MLLKLPDRRTLTNYMGNTSGETGFRKLVEARLISEAESFEQLHSKVCSLIVDEMRVKEKLQYKQRDCFVEQVDIGREELNGDLVLANSLLCFVISDASYWFITVDIGAQGKFIAVAAEGCQELLMAFFD